VRETRGGGKGIPSAKRKEMQNMRKINARELGETNREDERDSDPKKKGKKLKVRGLRGKGAA